MMGIVASFVSCARPRPAEHPTEVAEIAGAAFSIRISEFPEENGGFVPGAYYLFEGRPHDGKKWVTAMQFRHDDPVPIPKQNVKFLTPEIAFVFMGWRYSVTTDGGKNWHLWSAETDLTGWKCCNYGLINAVELSQSGKGKMTLSPIQGRAGEVPRLFTADFGRHWVTRPWHD
jgi:hypothetical protein